MNDATAQREPKAIILAGQPGAGKGELARLAAIELQGNVVPVDPDELRKFHPQVSDLRNAHPYTWSGYTHPDASQWAQELLQATIEGKKNLIFDTTLSNGQWSSELIKDLQSRGYAVEVRAMAAHKLVSEHGVDERFSTSLDQRGHGRYVPEGAREAIYSKLPVSLDTVHAQTTAPIRIFNRQGVELYDSRTDARPPGQVLEEARNAWFKDPAVTQMLRENWQQQADWHRDLPAHVQDLPNSTPALQEQLLAERAELAVEKAVASHLEGIATIDELVRPGAPPARVPVPEPEIPGLGRAGMTAGLAGLGVAATAYDASQTGERVATLLAQDNLTAARSEALHFAARGAGGWAGGAAAASVVGTTGAGPVALVVADAYLFSAAADKAVTLWDNRQINTQTDKQGVSWEFNGSQWLRQEKADLHDDGVDTPQKQGMFALPEKARELNYHASSEATEQALGEVQPRNPYAQPSSEADAAHLYARDWRHDPASGQWSRMVADEVDRNDRPIWTPDPASPERNAALDQQAAQVVDANIARGPAAIAATYEAAYRRNGWEDFGPVPAAVQAALNPDALQASDGRQYQRDTQGQWRHDGVAAEGNVPLELNATRERLQPALEQHAQAMAQMPARQTPTLQQQDQANTEATYAAYTVAPNAQTAGAIQLAVQKTREANGIDAATTSLALERDSTGQYSVDSPIQHLSRGADGVVRVAAITSTDDIHQARGQLQARHQEHTPLRVTPTEPTAPAQTHATALRPGDHGAEVQALQASLIQLGINDRIKTPVEINGVYDQPTQRGVQAFQLMHGMDEINGIADRSTVEAVQQAASAIAQRAMASQQAGPTLQDVPHGMMAAPASPAAASPDLSQSDLHAQHQQQALDQQRQWQLQQEQTLQQERGRLKEQNKAEEQPDQAPVASAIDSPQRGQTSPTLQPMSDPAHPCHALYADVKDRLEAKGTPLPEDRLHQVTTEMYIIGFKPDWRGRVDVVNDTFYAQHATDPTKRMNLSLAEPAPSIQESMQQAQTHTLETTQQQAAARAKQDQPTQPGPVMG
ncbi:zeta toxin family protein [Xanthomonas axonopodis pv. poinsettiicola]|uniref:zeta toxin family protein n=1 Tax=Xanthomonas TaxID=338 RepID=UPI001E2B29AE|nr:zeta toxin family protein [Xanthomonas codiaei]MCC8535725.1 zeta toxin family protein [Xanthomonas codiaei]